MMRHRNLKRISHERQAPLSCSMLPYVLAAHVCDSFILLVVIAAAGMALGSLCAHALDAARAAVAERRSISEGDVTLTAHAHNEGRNRHNLLGDGDVTLLNQDAGVVHGLGKASLEDDRLQAALENVRHRQRQHVIQLVLLLVEEAVLVAAAHYGGTLQQAAWVVLRQRQKQTGRAAHLRQRHVHAPDLTLAAQTVLAAQLHLAVEALLFERTAWRLPHTVEVVVVAHLQALSDKELCRLQVLN
ncbi:40S ribosomal protein S9, putative [Leishmania tarentolae]|uniref:40S ribosomal protein S9, putative n=1 Tax=Leishmania tarentolae TaxID=5689 RepID=A0A640KVA2_LEITA|nr:40S ribosomal protein S9, putative [Leishmania tarentolae]